MSSLSSDEKIKRANELKVAANELLQKCRYNDAIAKYTEAIELHPGDEVFWANRAQANIKAGS
jgi:tetratricopeptide (TPR) repeat protein